MSVAPEDLGIFIDSRMGGVKQYYYGPKPKDFDMRVPDELKDSVCFLCGKKKDGSYEICGTGFFVNVPSEMRPKDAWYIYLVTAKHIVDEAKDKGYDHFHLRINTEHGGVDLLAVPDSWRYPSQPGADVAVMPIYEFEQSLRVATMPIQMALANETSLNSRGVGIGDEVMMVGLFNQRYGHRRNIPIVRGGMLAAMPEEPIINEETGELYEAYLVEIRSISGLSGSPVIVFKQEPLPLVSTIPVPVMQTNGYLLGLVRGHWLATNVEAADSAKSGEEGIHTGIAIVTPIKEAVSIINGEELIKDRRRLERLWLKENQHTTLD